jgi:hypothetical protein
MKADSENVQTFTAMFEGFAQAAQRFDLAIKDRDPTNTFIPLLEMLNWAVALDERVRTRWCPEGKPLSWEWRDRVNGAEIMRGVQYVRNSVHHQWSDALELDERGRSYPKSYPVVFFEWRWRPASDLPEPEKRHQDKWWKEGKEVYKAHLQGEMARLTVQQLANVFNHLRKLMEPPLRPGLSTAEKLLAVQPNASAGLPRKSLG